MGYITQQPVEKLLKTLYTDEQRVVKPDWSFSGPNYLHGTLKQPFSDSTAQEEHEAQARGLGSFV